MGTEETFLKTFKNFAFGFSGPTNWTCGVRHEILTETFKAGDLVTCWATTRPPLERAPARLGTLAVCDRRPSVANREGFGWLGGLPCKEKHLAWPKQGCFLVGRGVNTLYASADQKGKSMVAFLHPSARHPPWRAEAIKGI